MSHTTRPTVKAELDRLAIEFFRAVSFDEDGRPAYGNIFALFIGSGLLIKNSGSVPEVSTLRQFIEPREAVVNAGELTSFLEEELWETTEIFGNVAHRFSAYSKRGVMNNASFEAKGMISTQFILTPDGWRMSSMAWDDERAGLAVAHQNLRGSDTW